MDGRRFDDLARTLAARSTRRRMLGGFAGGVLGALAIGSVGAAAPQRVAGVLATFETSGQRFRVWAVNPETIRQLRQLQRGELTDPVPFPTGRFRRGAGYRQHNAP